MTLEHLIALGFDKSEQVDTDHVMARCSQCEVLCINGTACHERGCPNEMKECDGCNEIVPRGVKYCEECR